MRKTFLVLLPLFMCLLSLAQVKTDFNNNTVISSRGQFLKGYREQIDFELPARNIDELLSIEKREQLQSEFIKPFKLAVPVPVNLDVAQLISWNLENEYAYGKYTIKLNGALSSSINFDKFYLPPGTEMFIYNQNGNMITGPVTEAENNKNNIWGSWVYKGEILTIEIKTPLSTKYQLQLHASNIAYGYKEVYKSIKTGGFGWSGACNINVICPLGNGWEAERNSVAAVLSATGGEFCSGSMVMNACNNSTPYFLTANHCFDFNPNPGGWRFTFQAWSPTCPNPGTNAAGVMFNGSTLRARNAASDFCLVELNTTPGLTSGIHYAGWSRSTTAASNATAIHHPNGDVMKISRANNAVSSANFAGSTNQHWRADWSPQNNGAGATVTAVTEGGSSGSPLFDQNRRVIGQLHGGPSACNAALLHDFYGRFDKSWTGGGANNSRLSNWLGACNAGATTTNTTNVCNLIVPPGSLSITGSSSFCTGSQTYTLSGAPAGATINWQTSNGLVTLSGSGTTVTATAVSGGRGYVTLTANVAGCTSASATSKSIAIGAPVSITMTSNGCSGEYQYWNLSANPSTNGSNWNWTVGYVGTNSYVSVWNPSSPSTMVSVKGGGTVSLTYTDACGISRSDGVTVWSSCYSYPYYRVSVSPNPARDQINVSLTPVEPGKLTPDEMQGAPLKVLKSKGKTIMTLYNLYTKAIVKQWTYNESKTKNYSLPVSGISKGIYVLQVDRDDQTKVTKLIIE